ncbi:MAG: ShlB/FhaC/HecB family hemolysin secretion/activation protein [Cyanobacteria bacterium P01_E01_bin.42]
MSKKDLLSGASIALLAASLVQTKASARAIAFSTIDDCEQNREQKNNIVDIEPIAEPPRSEENALKFKVLIPVGAIAKEEKITPILPSLDADIEVPLIEKNLSKSQVSVPLEIIDRQNETETIVLDREDFRDRRYAIPESVAIAELEEAEIAIDSELFENLLATERDITPEVENNSAAPEIVPDEIAPMGREFASQWGAIEREMLPSFWYEDNPIAVVKSPSKTQNLTPQRENEEGTKKKTEKELPPPSRELARDRINQADSSIFPMAAFLQTAAATLGQFPAIEEEAPTNTAIERVDICPLPSTPDIPEEPIAIGHLTVSGATAFPPERIRYIVNQALDNLGIRAGDRLSPDQQEVVANNITQLYLESGYLTSRARFTEDTLAVSEGRLAEITVRGRQHLNADYICDRLLLGADIPFNVGKLEEQLRLMRESPLFANIEASLEEAGLPDRSRLTVNVTEAEKFYGSFGVDNYSPAAVGSERMGLSLGDRNLTGRGDLLQGTYSRSTTGGADVLDISYQVPVNAKEGTVQLRFAPNWTEITQPPFDQLEINGRRRLYGINYRQPLVRNLRQEFALSLGFNRQEGQTFIFDRPLISFEGVEEDGSSRTSTITFAQDYLHRDRQGVTAIGSQFNFGTELLGVTRNESPTPDGLFFSWSGQVQRVQNFGSDRLLLAQLNLQLTPDTLLPAHQFIIGGGQSIRGYRQNARAGDNGIRLLVEGRFPVTRNAAGEPEIQLAPFFNAGKVWNHPDNPNQLSDRKFLAGVGLGILWDGFGGIDNLKMRLDYGVPLVYLTDRGKNVQDNGFSFQMQVEF